MSSTAIAADAASAFLSPYLESSPSHNSSSSWREVNSPHGDNGINSSGNNYRNQDESTLRNSGVLVNCMDDDFRADMASGMLHVAPPSAPPQDDDTDTAADDYYGNSNNSAGGGSVIGSNLINNKGSDWAASNSQDLGGDQPPPPYPAASSSAPFAVSPPPEAESKVVTLNLKQPVGMSVSAGGVVLTVNPGEQAELCGITPGSVMVAVAGDSVQGGAEFEGLLEAFMGCGLAEVELAFLQPCSTNSSALTPLTGGTATSARVEEGEGVRAVAATAPQYEEENQLPVYPNADVVAVAVAAKARSQFSSSSGFVVVDAAPALSSSSKVQSPSPGLLSSPSQPQPPPRLPPLIDGYIDRGRVPRQPWQDVAMGVGGTAARDVALHFVARWNHHRAAEGGLREGSQMPLPFVLPFSDNLDTDYKLGLPTSRKGNTSNSSCSSSSNKHISGSNSSNYNANISGSNGSNGVGALKSGAVGAGTGAAGVDLDRGEEHVSEMDDAAAAARAAVLLATAELPNSLGALPMPVPETASSAHCEVQVLRSAGPWSLGVTPEKSIYHAWCQAIEEAEHCIYIEQQYFITSLEPEPKSPKNNGSSDNTATANSSSTSSSSNPIAAATTAASTAANSSTTNAAARSFPSPSPQPQPPPQPHRLVAVVPPNAEVGSTFHVKTLHPLTGEESLSVVTGPPGSRPGDQIVIEVDQLPVPPPLPSYASSSSSSSLAQPSEYPGNNSYNNTNNKSNAGLGAQMAGLATSVATAVVGGVATVVTGAVASVGGSIQERVDGAVQNRIGYVLWQRLRKAILDAQHQRGQGQTPKPFRVLVVLPLHPNGRFLESTDCQALMQLQFDCIGRGDKSLLGKLKAEFPDEDLTEYVLFCSLRTAGEMTEAGPVSEQVYVHSKVLIVDDRVAIVGSANVNDRSMSGDRDSEIACRVVDHVMLQLSPSVEFC